MDQIIVKNIFAAVFEKGVLDDLLEVLDRKTVRFLGTEGTVKYLKKKGFSAKSVVWGFDFDGRVKSLDRSNFTRILADRTRKRHLEELKRELLQGRTLRGAASGSGSGEYEPFDLVIVDLYAPNKKTFPESMDIGGQALIRAAVKNYKNVGVAFDGASISDVAKELRKNSGLSLPFRKKMAKRALVFIAKRASLEAKML